MTNSIFGIGVSGLAAAQAGLVTTGQNISNVNTPGYNRQEAIQLARFPQFTGSGFFGQGVDVVTVRRVYNDFLAAQMLSSTSETAHLAAYGEKLDALDGLFGDPKAGLSPALDSFFAAVNDVAAHPSSAPSRQSLLSAGGALVSRFREIEGQLSGLRQSANDQLRDSVGEANSYITQIAGLNRRIAEVTSATSDARTPNDLLDQRDGLVAKLAGLVDARVVKQQDGSYNVFLAGGQALVVGQRAYTFEAGRANGDPRDVAISLDAGGNKLPLTNADLAGGTIGGVLAFRDGPLVGAQNELGRIALVLADAFNAQHRLGQDANAAAGGDFFTVPVPEAQAALDNTGSGVIAASIADTGALAASDYEVRFTGSGYTVTRLSDRNAQSFATLPATVDGVAISLASGSPAAGDTFVVRPTRAAARDLAMAITTPAKVAAATPVTTGAVLGNTGTGAISPGTIDASYWSTPLGGSLTLTYASATTSFAVAPASAATVTVGGTTTSYAAGAAIPYTAGATVTIGGASFTLSGQPANGDRFTIGPNASGVGDNRNAQALAALADVKLVAGGTATLGGALGQLVASIGTAAREAGIEHDAQASLLSQIEQQQQGVSGVNLDEEAANLQKYQQAYQAASKVLQVAASLFETILDLGR